jgi:Zn-finger nucleic acid-binding protein
MKCPHCKTVDLATYDINDVKIHACYTCHGFWFAKSELEKVKDEMPQDAWFDLDIWDDKEKTVAKQNAKICPTCNVSLWSLDWDNSHVIIDICKKCNGVWLEHGEFKKVMDYIRNEANIDILYKYRKTLEKKIEEVFDGKEKPLMSEIHDLFTFMNMFNYRMMVVEPELGKMLVNIPVGL